MAAAQEYSHGPAQSFAPVFSFLDPLPLVDDELELVAPGAQWIDGLLAACDHPLTRELDAESAGTTRQSILKFLRSAPAGHEGAERDHNHFPVYHFWMRLRPGGGADVPMAGTVCLRVGRGPDIEMYFGHFGYGVYPPARGRHYAERACRLLFPLARHHGLAPLWVTTDPQNDASRRTCQRLSGVLVDTVAVPADHRLYARGQRYKCRYRIDL